MKNIKLDTILLFALVIPFIMTYRISPGDTPIWLFGLIFFSLLGNVVLDLGIFKLTEKIYNRTKLFLLWFLVFAVIGAGLFSEIIVRHQTSPVYHVNDIVLQQEAAIKFLVHGQNPYAVSYINTPMAQFHYSDTEINPALYHFVMQPFYVLFAIPFYLVMGHTIGYFDARVPLFVLFIALLILAQFLQKDPEKKREFMTLLAFNPAMLGYFIEGRDDIFMYTFLFAAFYLLYKKKFSWAGVLMALAFTIKQSVWPLFPFYAAFLYFSSKSIRKTIIWLIPFSILVLAIIGPFFFWNSKAFLNSTIFYLSGNTTHSYPIAGYGLGMLLYQAGIIKNVHQEYPFIIWQIVICLPLLIGLVIWLSKKNTVVRLVLSYGIFLFVFWYLNRYFNNSHVGFLSMVFITAYFLPDDKFGKNMVTSQN